MMPAVYRARSMCCGRDIGVVEILNLTEEVSDSPLLAHQ
jgi:hypothetical protein